MINPQCSKCKNRLDDYGAILFSPPLSIIKDGRCEVNKIHLCSTCYGKVFNFIIQRGSEDVSCFGGSGKKVELVIQELESQNQQYKKAIDEEIENDNLKQQIKQLKESLMEKCHIISQHDSVERVLENEIQSIKSQVFERGQIIGQLHAIISDKDKTILSQHKGEKENV